MRPSLHPPGPRRLPRDAIPSAPAHPLPRPGGPQEEGLRHRSSATSGGSSTRSSRWSSTSSSCRSSSTARPARLPALHLRRDPALEVVHEHRSRTAIASVVSQEQAHQADPVPEARPAGRRRPSPGIVNFAFGLIPLCGLLLLFYPGPDHAGPPAHPGHRGRPVRLHAGAADPARPRSTSSSATSATSPGTSCGCGSTCRPALYGPTSSSELASSRTIRSSSRILAAQPVRDPLRGLPLGHLRRPRPDRAGACPTGAPSRPLFARVARPPRRLAIAVFKRLEPSVRQGPVTSSVTDRPASRMRPCRPMSPSMRAASASSTACASPARRRMRQSFSKMLSRERRRRRTSGRSATWRSGSSTASRSR